MSAKPAPGTGVWGVRGGLEGLEGTVVDPDGTGLLPGPHHVLVRWENRTTLSVVSVQAIAWQGEPEVTEDDDLEPLLVALEGRRDRLTAACQEAMARVGDHNLNDVPEGHPALLAWREGCRLSDLAHASTQALQALCLHLDREPWVGSDEHLRAQYPGAQTCPRCRAIGWDGFRTPGS